MTASHPLSAADLRQWACWVSDPSFAKPPGVNPAFAPILLDALQAMLPFVARHTCCFHGPMFCDACEVLRLTNATIAQATAE